MFASTKLGPTLFCVVLFLTAPSIAQVVEDDAGIVRLGGPVRDYELGLAKTTLFGLEESNFNFSFFIDDLGNDQFQFRASGIAELFGLFFAMPGDRVIPEFVDSNVPFASNFGSLSKQSILTVEVGESVYFGYWDDRGFEFPDENDNYGWVELSRSDRQDSSFGQLEILGGATAIGRGIVVGTTNTIAIPEPSAAVLVALLGAIGSLRRRRS